VREFILIYAPLALYALLLLARCFPGEDRILRRWLARVRRPVRRRSPRYVPRRVEVRSRLERVSMSGRGPPCGPPCPAF
jgi:hypothetical protein